MKVAEKKKSRVNNGKPVRRHAAGAVGGICHYKCPGCGNTLGVGNAFCPHCGKSLKKTCPVCGKPVKGDGKICPACGAKIDAGEVRQV
jgi:predicted amidophosphoribosyltransferase